MLFLLSDASHVLWVLVVAFLSVLTYARQQPLKVATYSTELAPGPDFEKSLQHVNHTLTGSTIDVVCMQGVYANLSTLSAGLPEYPHIYSLPKVEGRVPCKCEAAEVRVLIFEAVDCMSGQCKGQGGTMMAFCLMGEQCLGKLKDSISPRCIACIGSALSDPTGMSDPMNLMTACTRSATDPERNETQACEGPYGGSYGVAVASKFPFSSTRAIHFPNSIVCNRGYAHVSVDVGCGSSVEVLCGWWRSNATILPAQFGFDYFPPQKLSNLNVFYGTDTLPSSPVDEVALQSKYTADYVDKEVETSKVTVIAGNFGVGPNIPDANIGSASSETYKIHANNFALSGFSNPMVSSSAPVCSDCVHDMLSSMLEENPETAKSDMASWWNISQDALMSRVAETQNMLIDHVWIRGVKDAGNVTPFRTPVAEGASQASSFRYPMGISLSLDVGTCEEASGASKPCGQLLWVFVCTIVAVCADA